jgi:hypothetical protein
MMAEVNQQLDIGYWFADSGRTMAFQTPQHRNANELQKMLMMQLLGTIDSKTKPTPEALQSRVTDPRQISELIRVWIDLEHLKREMRGIPRLKPAAVGELLKRAKAEIAASNQEPIEVEEEEQAQLN